jgi:hypothetical protein
MVDRKQELVGKEDAAWKELSDLLGRVPDDRMEEPGVTDDGWTVKDLIWHIACWSAMSGRELERIRMGTYEETDSDTDTLNAEFEAEGREMDLASVRIELGSARNRALSEWAQVTELSPEAEEWFYESGAEHYADHLPDLRRWVEKLP